VVWAHARPEITVTSRQTNNGLNLDLRIPPKCAENKSLGQKNNKGQTSLALS
jgi:hypothetical protein